MSLFLFILYDILYGINIYRMTKIHRLRRWHERITFTELGHFAVLILGAGTTGMYFIQRWSQWKIQQLAHYKEAIVLFEENEAAKALLGGDPIRWGRIDLFNRKYNFVGATESKLKIPVIGPEAGGFLDMFARRKHHDEGGEFVTETLELDVDGGNRYRIFDRQAMIEAAENALTVRRRAKRPRLSR